MSYRITVGQYQQLQSIVPQTEFDNDLERVMHEQEIALKKLSIVFKKPVEFFEGVDFKKLREYQAFMKIIEGPTPTRVKKVFWINGTRYKASTDVETQSNEIWLSLIHYRQIGVIPNLHHILSHIYRPTFINDSKGFHPIKWMFPKLNPKKYADDFLKAKMSDVYGTFFLFLRKHRKWKAALEYSRSDLMNQLATHLTELEQMQSQKNGAGIIP